MTHLPLSLAAVVISALAIVPGAGASPSSSAVLPAATQAQDSSCVISDARLSWGIKESFRSYISGTIAKGEWETSDGASYETPSFVWEDGEGSYDPENKTTELRFTGVVHFTGHGGILDMTLANPSISVAADGTSLLFLDIKSTDTSGKLAVDETRAELGKLDAKIVPDTDNGSIATEANAMTLTETGAPAFGGFYEAGDELDPVTFAASMTCPPVVEEAAVEQSTENTSAPAEPVSPESGAPAADAGTEQQDVPWLPIGIGAGVLAIAAAAFAVMRRRRNDKSVS